MRRNEGRGTILTVFLVDMPFALGCLVAELGGQLSSVQGVKTRTQDLQRQAQLFFSVHNQSNVFFFFYYTQIGDDGLARCEIVERLADLDC